MLRSRAISTVIFSFLLFSEGLGQDIHFSQFYNSPLTLNPALTGRVNGSVRFNGIYRNQWKSILSSPFVTVNGSFDVPIIVGKSKTDAVGIGLSIFHDKAGANAYGTLSAALSTAYHKSLGLENNHFLTFGIQFGFYQMKVDLTDAIFEDEISNTVHTPGTLESITRDKLNNIDLNAGLMYSARFGRGSNLYMGASFFHLLQPDQNFTNGLDDKLPIRYVGHGGVDIFITKVVGLIPSIIYMNQSKNAELNLGGGLRLGQDPNFIIGTYYRVNDAVIPTASIEFRNFMFGVSYDVNTSALSEFTNKKGAFELTFQYVAKKKKAPYEYSIFFCPRF